MLRLWESLSSQQKRSAKIIKCPLRIEGGIDIYKALFNEQVCVATAKDRKGSIIIEPIGSGRITTVDLLRLCWDNTENNATIITEKGRVDYAHN